MPDHRTLMQRLRDPHTHEARSRDENLGRLRRSVLENLQRLCNTTQGSTQANPDYGMPPMSEAVHSFPEALGKLERALKMALRKYEPRLARVRVNSFHDPDDPLILRFDITGRLIAGDTSHPFSVRTSIDGSGRVAVDI
jgi:type VI secretion system protein